MLTTEPHDPERDRAWLQTAVRGALPDDSQPVVGLLGYADARAPAPDTEPSIWLTPGEVYVGPLAVPGRPCGQCFALRWQKVRSAEFRDVLEHDRAVHAVGPNPYLTPFLVDTIAALCTRQRPETSTVYRVDAATLRVRGYELLADSTCPRCAPEPRQGPGSTLRSRPKPTLDADRQADAETVLRHREALVNPVCGMLGGAVTADHAHTTTAPATGHFLVRDSRDLFPVHFSGHADSYAASSALALCEAMERYAGLACCPVPTAACDSYQNLAEQAIDPALCGLYEDQVEHGTGEVFLTYQPDLPIHWVWGHRLTDDRPVLVPQQLAYYRTVDADAVFVKESSNGCASGSCLEEAILHGLLEVVERDAFLLAWYGAAALPEIDPDSCHEPATRNLLARVRRLGYQVRVFDARIDLDIPVAVVAARHQDHDALGALSISAAAHLVPERAVASALREVASSVADLTERTTSDLDHIQSMAADFRTVTTLAEHAALFGLPEMAKHADFLLSSTRRQPIDAVYAGWLATRPSTVDLTDDVRFCVDRLAARGFDVVAVDQTTQEGAQLGLHAVRVLVPGMIPIDFGWSKQRALRMPRMFTAFREAGWRDTDLDPAELHRVPHPFM